jgi:hypothetical protein
MPLTDAEPGLRDDVLRDGARRHVHPRDPQHGRRVLLDEHHERELVAGSKALDDRKVLLGRDDAGGAHA